MVTGDNVQTAKAIALECGILDSGTVTEPVIIEGRVFRAYSEKQREKIAAEISVSLKIHGFESKCYIYGISVKNLCFR